MPVVWRNAGHVMQLAHPARSDGGNATEDDTPMLKFAVVVTGIVSALLFVFPFLVTIGLISLILPGMIAMAVPTIFAYLALALLLRTLLPFSGDALSTVVSLALALVLGWAVMQPWRLIESARHDALHAEDVYPPRKLVPSGHVRLDRSEWDGRRDEARGCDPLCLALLALPTVDSVTRVPADGERETFRLGGEGLGEPVRPVAPGELLAAFRTLEREEASSRATRPSTDGEAAVTAGWALRLAGERTLRRAAPARDEEPGWTARFVRRRDRDAPRLDRLEITDATGRVRARVSVLEHDIPARFFHVAFVGGGSNEGWRIGTQRLGTSGRRAGLDPDVAFLRAVALPRPEVEGDEIERLREGVADVLADPDATPQALALAETWVDLLGDGDVAAKLPLLGRILEDLRVRVPGEVLDRWLSGARFDLSPLRRGLARRLLRSDEPATRRIYARLLVDMPDGTFASPSDEEQTIWRESLSLQEGASFVERMADRGEAAVPELLDAVASALEQPWHRRWRTLRGAREAFKRLGTDAEGAIATIRPLLARRDSPLVNSADDRLEWLVALARLGVPLDELPYLERWTEEERVARAERVRWAVERYQRSRAQRRRRSGSRGRSSIRPRRVRIAFRARLPAVTLADAAAPRRAGGRGFPGHVAGPARPEPPGVRAGPARGVPERRCAR